MKAGLTQTKTAGIVGVHKATISRELRRNRDLRVKGISLKDDAHEWGKPDMSVLNPRRKPPEFPTQLFGPLRAKWITV